MPGKQHTEFEANLPITKTCEIVTGFLLTREERSVYPQYYEVVKVQAADYRNVPRRDTFHQLTVPIDCLDECIMLKAIQFTNLRCISFENPVSSEAFMANGRRAITMALIILTRVRSLTNITLCADMLNDHIFRALSSQSFLREVRLLQPSPSFHPGRVAQIREVLGRGVPRLRQLEIFKFPVELVTRTAISSLGRSPRLHCVEAIGSAGLPYPRQFFIGCLDYLHPQTPGCVRNLQLLKIKGNFTLMLRNMKFIKE